VILPARPGKSRDKAKVEVGVQVAERWIVARLRHQTHFSLSSLSAAVAELREELNDRRMRVYGKSRRELFEEVEKNALKPLPAGPFPFAEWRTATVNIDYHVEVDHHYYSVPHALIHERVEVRLTARTVEALYRGQRVASHVRSFVRGHHTTDPSHMPKAHRAHAEWSPSRIVAWAATVGERTAELVGAILAERPHPEQGYRSCLGILRLSKRYGRERLESACGRAVTVGARSYRHVESTLKNGLDRMPLFEAVAARAVIHENIRGGKYYGEGGDDAHGTDGGQTAGAAACGDGVGTR
jgi:transposase